jgi:Carboxypeptidase regulatory-like domain
MTNYQESKFSMYLATTGFCDANGSFTSALPNFTTNLTALKSTCTQIQSIGEQQKIVKTGITDNKNQLKSQVIALAVDNARKLIAYAKFTNNQTLMAEIHYTDSDFKRSSDSGVKDLAQIIYDRAQSNVASLATYGISTITQTALLTAINNYNATLAAPRIGITVTSQNTKQLATLFGSADALISNMDAAVEIIRVSQPNFYHGYRSARKVISSGKSMLSVRGVVTDATNGTTIKGATVIFQPLTNEPMMKAISTSSPSSNKSTGVSKKTAEKGGFRIKSLPAGNYQVTIKKMGYADQTMTVSVNDGEMSVVNVEMVK